MADHDFDGAPAPLTWEQIRAADRPFAPACERNKGPILEVLRRLFADATDVLEIGSGTGQHAVWFAAGLPHLTWRTSDLVSNHAGINVWIDEAGLANLERPLALDVAGRPWPIASAGGVFSANTAHYMHWSKVEAMFGGVADLLPPGARFALYGPFARDGRHTSASNAAFDRTLRAHDPGFGVRDRRDLEHLATGVAMQLEEDVAMPSNNRILVWRKAPDRLR
ncbi:MAG: DUF938 domain-containing protein [Thiotrichales bacterium]|nr:DUF938 domain-containing protein [Thiotrichales bacterium]